MDTRVHAAMHFQLERRLLVESGMLAIDGLDVEE
jgi:hypothetical protein